MKLAFLLFEYSPYGGLQRDFLRVARAALVRGHRVQAVVSRWEGARPTGLEIVELPVRAASNHARMRRFAEAVAGALSAFGPDQVLGFNRLPGLDAYFASDSCFAEQLTAKPSLVRVLPRYRTYLKLEQAALSRAYCFFLNDRQKDEYLRHYRLARGRYEVLPPGIEKDRKRADNATALRADTRRELGLAEHHKVVLFLGSGFRVKGLDRALTAFAGLPRDRAGNTRLLIVGNDDAAPYLKGLNEDQRQRVHVLGPRDDVPALLQAADLLLHPAYRESAGLVLLEAAAAGLPVLTTDTCGFARYVSEAGAGEVISSPFQQASLNRLLIEMVDAVPGSWSAKGIEFGRQEWLYRLPERVVDRLETLQDSQ
ncbi:MAG: glycosyltransferase family 4 protein [Alcanivorax sp.]|nr:glycosyltransferase family 4 protein [Alcanivorax sp.]